MSHYEPAPKSATVGVCTASDVDADRCFCAPIVCCVHCGDSWVWQKGSGRKRGWCTRCNGLCCGAEHCVSRGCVHWRQQLDNLEKGRPLDYKPISVLVPGNVPKAS